MTAMILAAGLGTRLGALTADKPKALVEINGVPLLEMVIQRLEAEGFDDITINAHHHAPKLLAFCEARRRTHPTALHLSLENTLLETGGGILAARRWLDGDEPFLIHNVDVVSSLPLRRLYEQHLRSGDYATLAVKERESSRQLLFDDKLLLIGARSPEGDRYVGQGPALFANPLAFSGVHVLSPAFFADNTRTGRFSIIDSYLDLARSGRAIRAWRGDSFAWKDVGRPEHLAQAARP